METVKKFLIALPSFPQSKGFNHPTILVKSKNKQDAIALARYLKPGCNIGEIKECKDRNNIAGTLNVETDWDFSLELNGKIYSDEEFSIRITLEELDSIKIMGPHGSPLTGRVEAIETALDAIRTNPRESFSNLGGNRGASWYPSE